jgi:lipoyl(octanoyl) transferase
MQLHVLPTRTSGAAENMAADLLLLQRYPEAERAARFRHYGWRSPAFTFGYAQKIAWVRDQLPSGERVELCRRPTGGGIVDHRDDWTYALVIPRGHPLEEQRAAQSYRAIHEALTEALRAQHVDAVVNVSAAEEEDTPAGVCFQRAEIFDVIHAQSGAKIAGAAQKRTKHGLLFQGSLWKPAAEPIAGASLDWERFTENFVSQLALSLRVDPQSRGWPEFAEGELEGLTENYSSPEWLEYR